MSRIGKLPVEIPSGVQAAVADGTLRVKGPRGELSRLVDGVQLLVEGGKIVVRPQDETRRSRQLYGLSRTLVANMVKGVHAGFEKTLVITGVGYRADLKGQNLTLSLGYSHPVVYEIPRGVAASVDQQTKIKLESIDRELLGVTAAKIRSFRPPDPYKAKGIRYADEQVRRKAGKSA